MKTPSPFKVDEYIAWRNFHYGDPWKDLKKNHISSSAATDLRTKNAQKAKDLLFSLTDRKTITAYTKA